MSTSYLESFLRQTPYGELYQTPGVGGPVGGWLVDLLRRGWQTAEGALTAPFETEQGEPVPDPFVVALDAADPRNLGRRTPDQQTLSSLFFPVTAAALPSYLYDPSRPRGEPLRVHPAAWPWIDLMMGSYPRWQWVDPQGTVPNWEWRRYR